MIKYEKEYKETKNKNDFIILAIRRYKGIKKDTARRRYYDMKNLFGVQQPKYTEEEKQKPNMMKLIQAEDIKLLKIKMDKNKLYKYGYNEKEIKWLEDEGYV